MRPGSMRRLTPRSACTPAKRLCTPPTSRKGTAASGGAGTGVIAGSERVLLVVGLVHVHPGLAGDDHALARAFLDADLVVAPRAQVHAVGDRLAVEQQLGHLVHHQAGVFRVPETDAVDGTGLQLFARVLRQADAEHAGLVLQPGFFHRAADADRVDRRTALETRDVGVLAQDFLGLFVGFVGVVEGLVVRVHQRHLRVLGRVARAAAGPLHVRAAAERADEGRPLAALAHALGEPVVQARAEGRVVEGFDIGLRVLGGVGLVCDDDDATLQRALEHAFDRARVHRHHGDGTRLFGHQVFDHAQLLRRVALRRADHAGGDAGVGGAELLDALTHAGEPVHADDFDHGHDALLVLRPRGAGDAGHGGERTCGLTNHGVVSRSGCEKPLRNGTAPQEGTARQRGYAGARVRRYAMAAAGSKRATGGPQEGAAVAASGATGAVAIAGVRTGTACRWTCPRPPRPGR